MKRSFLQYIIVPLIVLAVTSCQDDFIKEENIGEGKTSISATLDFKPMSSALTRTRTAGDALKEIKSLHVLLYGEDKNLIKSWKINEYSESNEERNKEDAENGKSAEIKTKRATFKLPERIDFGKYYMYAVANIPDLLTNFDISTVDNLKNIPLTWDSEDVANNGQMIGCLMTRTATLPVEDEPLILNENSTKLHAWLRRAASKVTVAFDGSALKEGVSIYLKALRIKNIPASCKLGTKNTVEKTEHLIPTGEEVVYSESTNFDANYPALITKDTPYYPRGQEAGQQHPDRHSETNPYSLFFYENMQGEGPNKQQIDANEDGILDDLYQYTEKPCATYIEVDAYYESTNPERPGICNITYRFMLGQNITTDYDAKRNCHYKLTLRLNGFADDPDWRIDYVSRLWVTQPETVDYRGKYFVPDNVTSNQGNNFSNNIITVTSFMYQKDSWSERTPMNYKIEYKDAGSTEFTETCPNWLDGFTTTPEIDDKGKETGVYNLEIKYKNLYTSQNINTTLLNNPAKTEIYDLATKGGSQMNTANCYIVDSKGTYQFPLVYGNAITKGEENTDSYTYKGQGSNPSSNYLTTFKNYKDEPIQSPYILKDIYSSTDKVPTGLSASLVWQDESNLITNIRYDQTAYEHVGGIQFTVGDAIKEGNAVIALKDPSGTIMWSWHIWVTAIDLSRTLILTNYDNNKYEIMPVNLGWCSGGIPIRYYDRHECEVRFTQYINEEGQEGVSRTVKIIQEPHIAVSRGNNPYFQWGRKDPFIAGGNADKTTKTWYTATETRTNAPDLMYATDENRVETYHATAELIKNPDKWQNGPRQTPGDWGNKYKPKDNIFFNLWDNSCWDGNDNVIKTIYDPCPAGYHVSSIYTFSGFTDYGESITDKQDDVDIKTRMYAATEENMMLEEEYKDGIFEFYTDKSKLISIGFPQNGYRDWDDNANLLQYNGYGEIWCAQANIWGEPFSAYHLEFNRYHHIYPWNNFYATDGFAIRATQTLPKTLPQE